MNILFMSELFYPHGGGAEFATYLYAKLLSDAGFNVTVVTNKFPGEQEYSKSNNLIIYRLALFKNQTGVKYSVLKRLDLSFSSFVRKLMKWANVVYIPRFWYSMILVAKAHKKPVIVHVHDYTPICPLAVMYDSSRKSVCRTRSICSARCIYQFEKNKSSSLRKAALSASLNLFAGIFSGKLIEPAEAVLCVSKAQRNVLINRFPPIRHKTRVIYNPLPDLSPLQINEEGFGYLGGLSLLKGFGVLYNALAILKDPSLKVYVTGLSTLNEKMVKAFGCVGMTMCKKLEYDKQDSLYRQIEGVIFPSIVPEPLPYVTAEAILRARILIASRIGGIPEQVKGCKGVFLFEAGNYFELAEILKYVKDLGKEKAIDLGFQNREVFVKNFSNEKTVTEFMNVINHVT